MGFLSSKPPAAAKVSPIAAPTTDDRRVQQAGKNAQLRAADRRDSADTIAAGSSRRGGGLAQAFRDMVGG